MNVLKTKYMMMSLRDGHEEYLKVGSYTFETAHFKYLGVTTNRTNNNHAKIQIKKLMTNKFYYRLANIFESKQVSLK